MRPRLICDLRERLTHFDELAAFSGVELSLAPDDGDPSLEAAVAATHEFLSVLGIAPLLGRGFTADDDGAGADPVLIGEDLWMRAYARDLAALGKTLRLDGVTCTIVSVLPRNSDFGMVQVHEAAAAAGAGAFANGGRVDVEVWIPLRLDAGCSGRANHEVFVTGRLKEDSSIAVAQQEATAVMADLEREYPRENTARGAHIERLAQVVFAPVRPTLIVVLGAAALVLLIACANAANLLLVRGAARVREISIRAALGASAGRLARQFLAEGIVITVAGAVAGVGVAVFAMDALLKLAPADIPRVADIGLDGRVLSAALVVTTLISVAFGLLPTLLTRRFDFGTVLHSGAHGASTGRERRRLRSTLVVGQLALAVMLMIGPRS